MQSVDLDNVTTQDIRKKLKLEPQMSNVVMNDYKEFIDKEMLIILGQLDKPSKITDYLYLGTEWNASNWDELLKNK
jgi:protein phosphatase slingshot